MYYVSSIYCAKNKSILNIWLLVFFPRNWGSFQTHLDPNSCNHVTTGNSNPAQVHLKVTIT